MRSFDLDLRTFPELERIDGTSIGRMYKTPDGLLYPSATTVFGHFKKTVINEWRARVGHEEADRISNEASTRGTAMHEMLEQYVRGDDRLLTTRTSLVVSDMFQQLKPHLDRSLGRILGIESRLWSDNLGVAGTTDLIAEWNGKLSVIDYKSSSKFKRESWIGNYFEQTTCYACMWEELTRMPVTQIVVLIAVKNGSPQVFVKKRNDYLREMIRKVQAFQRIHNLSCPSVAKIADRMALAK